MVPRRAVLAFPLAFVLVVALALPAIAAPGDLDNSFSGDGRVRVGISGGAQDLALQADGKIVAVGEGGGHFAIVRFNLDGTLDHSFSQDGIAHISAGTGRFDSANAVAIRNGKIVVVGTSERNSDHVQALAILRLNSNGTLDPTFSGDGLQLLRVGSESTGEDVAIQSDGRIVAVGTSDDEFLVVRRLSNGDADHSFSGDGSDRTGFASNVETNTVGIDPTNGRIVVGGTLFTSGGFSLDFAFAAYTKAGDLDHTFSGDGKMIRGTSRAGGLAALTVLSNGRIIAAGTTNPGQPGDQMLIEKYTRPGDLDQSFGGGDGITVVGFKHAGEANDDASADVAVQSDGKVVVVGVSVGADKRFAVVRLNGNGTLDQSFGNGGGVLTAFTGDAAASGVAINGHTHRIEVVGVEITSPPTIGVDAMYAARYLGA
jgi:uncharacterized delta-60 repeat protein